MLFHPVIVISFDNLIEKVNPHTRGDLKLIMRMNLNVNLFIGNTGAAKGKVLGSERRSKSSGLGSHSATGG